MRNDHKGETVAESGARIVYASGRRAGPDARADGKGGLLERGYWRIQGATLKGPFSSREIASF